MRRCHRFNPPKVGRLGGARHSSPVKRTCFVLLTPLLGGCLESTGEADFAMSPWVPPEGYSVPAVRAARPFTGPLDRKDVEQTVEAGLGRFLQRVDVEPSFRGQSFQGFRIVLLRPKEFWEGVDLRPGDVVTQVNGMPIGRETQAYRAFVGLLTADHLRVSYVRGGRDRQLYYDILPRYQGDPQNDSASRPSRRF